MLRLGAEVERLELEIDGWRVADGLAEMAFQAKEARVVQLEAALRVADRGLADAQQFIRVYRARSHHWCSNESEQSNSIDGAREEARAALAGEEPSDPDEGYELRPETEKRLLESLRRSPIKRPTPAQEPEESVSE